jgi:uroporphyrinogen-III synthase
VRAIVTRPQHEARAWVERLQAAGIEALALPLIDIAPPLDKRPLQDAWSRIETFRAAMFVSANAVRHFFAEAPNGVALRPRAWATGPGTADALRAGGVATSLIDVPPAGSVQFDSETLWRQVAAQVLPGDRVLIVRGGDGEGEPAGRDWLAQQLASAGAVVEQVVAYVRRAPDWSKRELDEAGAAAHDGSVWLFSSSEAVAHLRVLLPAHSWAQARAMATHPRIAQAARDAGFGEVREVRPAFEEVLASLQSAR